MFSMMFCLFLILVWCKFYVAMMCVNLVCLHFYVCYYLSTLDSNDPECTEEGRYLSIKKKKTRDRPTKEIHLLCCICE
jgi:hypothetical protein